MVITTKAHRYSLVVKKNMGPSTTHKPPITRSIYLSSLNPSDRCVVNGNLYLAYNSPYRFYVYSYDQNYFHDSPKQDSKMSQKARIEWSVNIR